MITEDDGHSYLASDLYISRIDGSQITKITNSRDKLEMNPSWSPDGDKIAYNEYGEGAIYLIKISK